MSKTKNLESVINRTERRILKLNREADKAYKRNHNIIAVNMLNKVVFHKGYTNETMCFELKSIRLLENQPNDLNADKCWEIKLGARNV